MSRIVVIAGTDTSVGQTVITAARRDLTSPTYATSTTYLAYTGRPPLGRLPEGAGQLPPQAFLQAGQTGLDVAVEPARPCSRARLEA